MTIQPIDVDQSDDLLTDIVIARAGPLEKQIDFCVLQKLLTENQYVCGAQVILHAELKTSTLFKKCYRKLFNHLYVKHQYLYHIQLCKKG